MVLRESGQPAGPAEASDQQAPPDARQPDGGSAFPSLLFEAPAAQARGGDNDADRAFARDLNLDQVVAAIAGDREDHELITAVLFAPLRDAGAVRYRQEVFRDLEDAALLDAALRFTGLMTEVRAHLRQ